MVGKLSVRFFSSGLAAVLGLAVALTASPVDLSAQCSGCVWTGTGAECGLMGGEWRCSGSYDGWCEPCAWVEVARTQLDGSIHAPQLRRLGEVFAGAEELVRGVTVVRSSCSGIITERYFTDEAAEAVRTNTARLRFG